MLKLSRVIVILSLFFIVPISHAVNSCIDINTATQEELDKIKYIGESRAKQIIILRGEKLFSSVDELDRVIGIGPAIVAKIKQEGLACVSLQQEPQPTTTAPLLEIRSPIIVYPSGIIFSEIMPSPEGPDETEEWIKIFNKNNFEIDLSGWQITDIIGKINTYTFPAGIKISAMGLLILNRPETKIILNNNADGLKLIQPDGKIVDSVNYEKAPQGQSYTRAVAKGEEEDLSSSTGLTNSGWVWNGKNSERKKEVKVEEKGLAAVSEPIIIGQSKRNFYPFLAALALAIFSGFVILFLKYKKT